jgi:hypothetical protein
MVVQVCSSRHIHQRLQSQPPMRRLSRPTTRDGRVATKARACYLAHRHTPEKMGTWLHLVPRPIDRRWSCRKPNRIVAGCARARITKGQEGRVANHYDHLRQELADACIAAMYTFQGQVHALVINRKICHGKSSTIVIVSNNGDPTVRVQDLLPMGKFGNFCWYKPASRPRAPRPSTKCSRQRYCSWLEGKYIIAFEKKSFDSNRSRIADHFLVAVAVMTRTEFRTSAIAAPGCHDGMQIAPPTRSGADNCTG